MIAAPGGGSGVGRNRRNVLEGAMMVIQSGKETDSKKANKSKANSGSSLGYLAAKPRLPSSFLASFFTVIPASHPLLRLFLSSLEIIQTPAMVLPGRRMSVPPVPIRKPHHCLGPRLKTFKRMSIKQERFKRLKSDRTLFQCRPTPVCYLASVLRYFEHVHGTGWNPQPPVEQVFVFQPVPAHQVQEPPQPQPQAVDAVQLPVQPQGPPPENQEPPPLENQDEGDVIWVNEDELFHFLRGG
ncbi:hypothetical protein Ancab_015339 [Ancistrocladus abbreviatus]